MSTCRYVALRELCDISSGLWTGKKPPFEEVGVIRNTNFKNDGTLDDSDIAQIKVEERQLAERTLQFGDIILEKSGGGPKQPVGRVVFYNLHERKLSFSNFTSAIRVKDGQVLSAPYLHKYLFWLHLNGTTETMQSHSTGIRNLNLRTYKELLVPVPPLQEQERILAVLNDAFDYVTEISARAREATVLANDLVSGCIASAFASGVSLWERHTLAELISRGYILHHMDGNHGGDYPRKEEFIESGIPYISAKCLVDSEVDMTKAKYLSSERAAQLRKGFALHDDVLFAHNATVGPVAVLSTDEPHVILGTSLTYYRCNPEKLRPDYLAHYMRSKLFSSQYLQAMGQMTRNQVPITKQREFFHLVPPLETQARLASQLDQLRARSVELKKSYSQKLALLGQFKLSLLSAAFSGNL